MYDLVYQIIDHVWTTGSSDQQYIYFVCCCLIIILTVTFIDFVYRIFSSFWRGRK